MGCIDGDPAHSAVFYNLFVAYGVVCGCKDQVCAFQQICAVAILYPQDAFLFMQLPDPIGSLWGCDPDIICKFQQSLYPPLCDLSCADDKDLLL